MSSKSVKPIVVGTVVAALAWGYIQASGAAGEELEDPRIGGQGSVFVRGQDAYGQMAANASQSHRRSFVVGNALFKENWVAAPASVKSRHGLGPLFNSRSCSGCHLKDGRGQPPGAPTEPFEGLLLRISVPGKGPHGEPVGVPGYGDQIQHRSILGVRPEADARAEYEEIHGKYGDGTTYSLLKPTYRIISLAHAELPAELMVSPRVGPSVYGLGLLEAISEKDLLAQADPTDKDGDGIRGRPNWVWDVQSKSRKLGRFGWKANQPSLIQQSAGAFLGDMGITSPFFTEQNCPPEATDCKAAYRVHGTEIDRVDLGHMETYLKILAVPARRDANSPIVRAGQRVFREAKCASCHVERYTTGVDSKFPENSKQRISPFTDLLLHDMGEALADNRPDFEAGGRDWRTPPLWGLGLLKEVNRHERLLHDGRARGFAEAILWHGGEAETSKQTFLKMSSEDRSALIRFLESL